METQKQEIKHLCTKFMLTGIGINLDQLITTAEQQGIGFTQFTLNLFQTEATHRQDKDEAKRLKVAGLLRSTNLVLYDAEQNGLKTSRLT